MTVSNFFFWKWKIVLPGGGDDDGGGVGGLIFFLLPHHHHHLFSSGQGQYTTSQEVCLKPFLYINHIHFCCCCRLISCFRLWRQKNPCWWGWIHIKNLKFSRANNATRRDATHLISLTSNPRVISNLRLLLIAPWFFLGNKVRIVRHLPIPLSNRICFPKPESSRTKRKKQISIWNITSKNK